MSRPPAVAAGGCVNADSFSRPCYVAQADTGSSARILPSVRVI
jgi:hypothetical protein